MLEKLTGYLHKFDARKYSHLWPPPGIIISSIINPIFIQSWRIVMGEESGRDRRHVWFVLTQFIYPILVDVYRDM